MRSIFVGNLLFVRLLDIINCNGFYYMTNPINPKPPSCQDSVCPTGHLSEFKLDTIFGMVITNTRLLSCHMSFNFLSLYAICNNYLITSQDAKLLLKKIILATILI